MVILWFLFLSVIVLVRSRDFYKILGVEKTSTTRQIKKAYRVKSLKMHPDKSDDPDAQEKFAELSEAYQVLTDEDQRRIYDQHGEEGLKQAAGQGGGGGHDPFDIFSQFFGGGGGGRRQRGGREQLAPITVDLPVTLQDLYVGRMFNMAHKKTVLCPSCRGTGAKDPDDVKTCPKCNGQGSYMTTRKLGPGFIQQIQQQCEKCGGKGKIVKTQCPVCRGKKVAHGHEEQIIVLVEEGMPDGHEITLQQEGDEHPDYTPGDIVFRIRTVPHRRFRRDGLNLHMRMRISLLQALTGFSKTFGHLDGHEVTVTRTGVTKPNLVIEVAQEGMPTHNFPSEKGSLFIEFEVVFPESITDEQAAGFKALLTTSSEKKTEL